MTPGQPNEPPRTCPAQAPAAGSPVVVGGTGGSGTRVVARLLMHLGVSMGAARNAEEDALALADLDWRWGQELLALQLGGHQHEFRSWASGITGAAEQEFMTAIRSHSAGHRGSWGWKHPHSYLLLPFIHRMFPGMRFVHVLRDGRDIALSGNQRQVTHYGSLLLDSAIAGPARSAAFWSRANCLAAEYAEARLPSAYLPVRIEDVCVQPGGALSALAAFLHLPLPESADSDAAQLVQTPATIGRWRAAPPALIAELEEAAAPALARFRYR